MSYAEAQMRKLYWRLVTLSVLIIPAIIGGYIDKAVRVTTLGYVEQPLMPYGVASGLIIGFTLSTMLMCRLAPRLIELNKIIRAKSEKTE